MKTIKQFDVGSRVSYLGFEVGERPDGQRVVYQNRRRWLATVVAQEGEAVTVLPDVVEGNARGGSNTVTYVRRDGVAPFPPPLEK